MTESEADAQRIAVVLRRRDARLRLKLRAQAALGLPLTLIGPVVLGTIFWLALRSMGGIVLPWSHVCGVALLVVVPLLIHLESRTGGDFLGTALREGTGHRCDLANVRSVRGPRWVRAGPGAGESARILGGHDGGLPVRSAPARGGLSAATTPPTIGSGG